MLPSSAWPFHEHLTPATLAELARVHSPLTLHAGEELFGADDDGDPLFLVLSGTLHAREPGAVAGTPPVRIIQPGAGVDQLQRLSGQGGLLRIEAVETTHLAVIPCSVVDSLVDRAADFRAFHDRAHRRQLLCRLHPILGTLDTAFLDELEAAAVWVHLGRGELLFEQNEVANGLYFIVSGRVHSVRHEKDGTERILVEAGRGDIVGELEFFTGEPRWTRVEAVRDSVLVHFDATAFETLLGRRPELLRQVTRSVATRAQLPPLGGKSSGRVSTIAVVGASPRARTGEFTRRLVDQLSTHGRVLTLTSARVDEMMDEPGISASWESSVENGRLLAWLESREEIHRFVVYQADPTITPWTRRCLRQADRVLLIAHGQDDPAPGEMEKALMLLESRLTEAHQALVLVHEDGSCLPTGTRRWLEPRTFLEEHHHLRWDREDDFARLGRMLAGRAVGIVLGGGGARGFAHIGILRALGEAGIPIDRIGGTSMGASLAAQWALGWTPEQIEQMNRRVWIEIQPHKRLTLPVVSLVASKQAAECGRMMYGETEIEDLWIPFFCISSNLTTAQMVVHRSGSLLRAVTASASLPGFAEPVVDGTHLLVDGALLNNVPTDVMRGLGSGIVIASEVSVEEDLNFLADRVPSVWELLRGRARFPSLMALVMRATLLHSTSREKASTEAADLCLRPPVDAFSLMDFSQLAGLVSVGYEYGVETLRDWAPPDLHPAADAGAPIGPATISSP